MSGGFDPLVPREIDLPAEVPFDIDVTDGPAAVALDDAKIFAAPSDPGQLPRWREQLAAWREGARRRHGEPERYDDPAAAWASGCLTVAQVWLWDELFFDHETQRFTPERFLADARQRFGGLDGIVLWHAYPVIGIDERNQWDFYRVPGLEQVVRELHEAGVRVFVDYNPWDTGTRRAGSDADELATVIRRLGADGVFLDTLKKADPDLVAALDEARPGIGLEGESKLATERIADHALSWAQWFADSEPPGVLRAHWFERRHMQHHIRRWHRDHSGELRSAWLNGVGVMVWEVVFSVWVGWNARDAATLRRMLPVRRRLHRWFVEGEWTPLAVCDRERGVYGSAFTLDGVTVYALANTSGTDAVHLPERAGGRWFALHEGPAGGAGEGRVAVHDGAVPNAAVSGIDARVRRDAAEPVTADAQPGDGTEPSAAVAGSRQCPEPEGSVASGASAPAPAGAPPAVTVPAYGIAALVHVADGAEIPDELAELRRELAADADSLVPERDASFPYRRARRLDPPAWDGPVAPAAEREALADGAITLEPGERILTVRHRRRETGMYDGAPYVDEWKPLPPRLHDQTTLERVVDLPRRVRVASAEVTEAQYARFLEATGEADGAEGRGAGGADPADVAGGADGRGADHAAGRGSAPVGAATPVDTPRRPSGARPVTGITLRRAREYAAWIGGRLPTEDEWQLAASDPAFERCSPRVWNWTESEHSDGRSRFVMLKGGSDHVSEGSEWYFDGGVKPPEFSAKYLLPGLGIDASPSIGFRVCWEEEA